MGKIYYANSKNFDNFINDNNNVIVDFWSKSCVPCNLLELIMVEIAKDHSKIKFLKVNVDECPTISSKFHIHGLPTLLFFKDGKASTSIVGLINRKKIEEKIKNNF